MSPLTLSPASLQCEFHGGGGGVSVVLRRSAAVLHQKGRLHRHTFSFFKLCYLTISQMSALVCCGNWSIRTSCTRTDSVTCEQVAHLELKSAGCWVKAGVAPFAAGLSARSVLDSTHDSLTTLRTKSKYFERTVGMLRSIDRPSSPPDIH